jgi:hypothetical protein
MVMERSWTLEPPHLDLHVGQQPVVDAQHPLDALFTGGIAQPVATGDRTRPDRGSGGGSGSGSVCASL